MKSLVLAVAAAALLAQPLPAGAQTPPPAPQPTTSGPETTTMPTWEFGLGYQLLRTGEFCAGYDVSTCTDDDAKAFPFGLMVDGVRNFGAFGIVGEFGWSRHSDDSDDPFADSLDTDLVHFGVGVRFTGRYARFWPYMQLLGGGVVNRFDGIVATDPFRDTRTRPMAQGSAGVTFITGDGWGLFVEGAYRRMFLDEEEDFISGRNDVRGVFGVRMILD